MTDVQVLTQQDLSKIIQEAEDYLAGLKYILEEGDFSLEEGKISEVSVDIDAVKARAGGKIVKKC